MSVDRAERILEEATPPSPQEKLAAAVSPIDWDDFWQADAPDADWAIEPIVPAGRQVAMFSRPKDGKSLLALDACAAAAAGRTVFGNPIEPMDITYIDLEMTEADLRERLEAFGYGPNDDLSRLHYYQLQSFPSLDTQRGGQVLSAVVAMNRSRLVVVDTMARATIGEEDAADTYRNFYRHTGAPLKQAGVALWRLDHAGKDIARGQRGSSGKADDVDVVFQLTEQGGIVTLTRTHTRVPWVPGQIQLRRVEEPSLHHVLLGADTWPAGTAEVACLLDELEIPLDASVSMAMRALRANDNGRRKTLVLAALKWRRTRP